MKFCLFTPTPQREKLGGFLVANFLSCSFFAYSWKLPAYSGAFLLTIDKFSFFTYSWSSFAYSFSFSTYSWSFFAYGGKARLIRALRDCKQRSLTVSKKAPTVSKKASPNFLSYFTKEKWLKICHSPNLRKAHLPRQGKKFITWNSLWGRLHVRDHLKTSAKRKCDTGCDGRPPP